LEVPGRSPEDLWRDYLTRVRSPESGYISVPFADDVELSMRLG
jgi:hypothetical protein